MRRFFFATFAAGAFGALVFACSLGLDESLIDKKDGSATSLIDANLPDGTTVTESGVPQVPNGQSCTVDTDCVAANACLTGRCDQARGGTCTFDVCRPSTCNVGVCNQAAKTCSAPAPYHEEASQFTLPAPLVCYNCAAAAYPWLFVATTNGVLAYNVSNVSLINPATVPVTGLGFVPAQMIRSGNRVWMVGNPSGTVDGSTFPIAYIDVPVDPFATSISAVNKLLTYNRPPEGFLIYPRQDQSLLLFGTATPFPTSFVTAPLPDAPSATASLLAPPDGTFPVAVSGTRVLLSAITGGVPSFTLVTGAGTATPSNGPTTTVADVTGVTGSRGFASAPDGTVFWSTAVNSPPAGVPATVTTTASVRGYFLVNDATSEIAAGVTGTVVEAFTNADATTTLGANAPAAGPVALLDNATALVTTAAKESPTTQTAVQIVKRNPLAPVAGTRVVIPAPIASVVGATASNGLGYVATNDAPEDAGAPAIGHIWVFDSACTP